MTQPKLCYLWKKETVEFAYFFPEKKKKLTNEEKYYALKYTVIYYRFYFVNLIKTFFLTICMENIKFDVLRMEIHTYSCIYYCKSM